jgi:hypothetical protein
MLEVSAGTEEDSMSTHTDLMEHGLATQIFWAMKAEAQKAQAEYDEALREWAEEGRAPHYCIHGRNLWVDYDIPCGECENGEPLWDDARDWADAKWRAAETFRRVAERREIVDAVRKADPENKEFIWKVLDWAFEPLVKIQKRFGI